MDLNLTFSGAPALLRQTSVVLLLAGQACPPAAPRDGCSRRFFMGIGIGIDIDINSSSRSALARLLPRPDERAELAEPPRTPRTPRLPQPLPDDSPPPVDAQPAASRTDRASHLRRDRFR